MDEIGLLSQFVSQLAMCEMLAANFLIQPSMAFDCSQIETFIKESYFDNDDKSFNLWWDSTVVPITMELQTMLDEQLKSQQ
tara:strand:- start:1206 stop:1448 length:243 start_codon:yes stop_codon:yes gene_type:complete